MFSTGFSLFFSGLAEIFLNLKKTLMICLPWVLFLGGLTWYAHENGGLWSFVLWIANWLVLPGVAVPWHRYMLAENIDPGRENAGIEVFMKYLIKWFIMSLIIGLFIVFFVFVFGSIAAIAFGAPGMGKAIETVSSAPFASENIAQTSALAGAYVLAMFMGVYLAHRLGYILPHVAVSEEPTGYFDAFMKTDPLRGALVVVSLLVTLAIVFSIGLGSLPFFLLGAVVLSSRLGSVPMALAFGMFQSLLLVVQTLVGASVLTEIYRVADGIAEEAREAHVEKAPVRYRR